MIARPELPRPELQDVELFEAGVEPQNVAARRCLTAAGFAAGSERPDFEGRWRFAGLSLLPAATAQTLEPIPTGLYERVWSRTSVDLVPTDITFIDCGTLDDLEKARQLAHG